MKAKNQGGVDVTGRIYSVFLFSAVCFGIAFARLIVLQVFSADFFKHKALNQHFIQVDVPAQRGGIYDVKGRPLAVDLESFSLYAEPVKIPDDIKEFLAEQLADIIDMPASKVFDRLSRKSGFVWIKRQLGYEKKLQIDALGIHGLGWIKEYRRVYPNKSVGSHIIGYVDIDRNGLDGAEKAYEAYLKGKRDGKLFFLRDARQEALPFAIEEDIDPIKGFDVFLTIDIVAQGIVEEALNGLVEKFNPEWVSAVVLDAETGRVIALANRPSFDPNMPGAYPIETLRDRAITDMYEPGSVFKVVTFMKAFEDGVVDESDVINCENGAYTYKRRTLRDHHPYGKIPVSDVLIFSSNIGSAKIAMRVGEDRFAAFLSKSGLLDKTGIDLPGEVSGYCPPRKKWSGTSILSIPMGQEVCVTLIGITRIFGAIANGGFLIRPHILDHIVNNDGIIINDDTEASAAKSPVIAESTAQRLRDLLVQVVERGTGKKAKIEGVAVGGKTGTAQRVIDGKYSDRYFMASFVGFAPASQPRFVIGVTASVKKPFHFGGYVCAPAFKQIAEGLLKYYGITVDDENAEIASDVEGDKE